MLAKSIFPLLLLSITLSWATDSRPATSTQLTELGSLRVGEALPKFAGVDLSQPGLELISKDDLQEWVGKAGAGAKPVIVFFSTKCIPCRVGLNELKDHAAELEQAKVQVLLVALGDDRPTVRSFLSAQGLKFHTLHDPDGKAAIRYGVMGDAADQASARIPVTVIGTAQGKVAMIITAEGEDYLKLVLGTK